MLTLWPPFDQIDMSIDSLTASFRHWVDFRQHRISKLRYSVLKKITRKSLPLFFKGGDVISLDPLANGTYEADVQALIEHCADRGLNHFLLDIGANIGLTSCQSGHKFKTIHLFEPNPNCLSILKINANIALRGSTCVIHEYGLGSEDATLQLHVPYDNWGGAFVKSKENEYDETVLSAKDGFGVFDAKNYDVVDVRIRSATTVFQEVFGELINKGLTQGVVKIDAEGYERLIIRSLLAVKPAGIQIAVLFENWKDALDVNEYFAQSSETLQLFKLESCKARWPAAPRWFNSMMNFLSGGFPVELKKVEGQFSGGTFLLMS